MTQQAGQLFVFGLGYSAGWLARGLQAEGWRIIGTSRSEEGCARLRDAGFEAHLFRRDAPLADAEAILAGTTHLLHSITTDEQGDPVYDGHSRDICALLPGLRWMGYLTTTGVYGDHDGAWVDEDTPLAPSQPRTQRRVEAELAWRALADSSAALPVSVFRLAGIYGPGRSALDSVREGRARRIDKPGQVFSRIHVEDIAGVLRASMAKPEWGGVYNVCDDRPAPPQDVITYACELIGTPPPPLQPYDSAELSPMARSFYADNRRVRNDRIKQRLGYQLRYPDYESGLKACLAATDPAATGG